MYVFCYSDHSALLVSQALHYDPEPWLGASLPRLKSLLAAMKCYKLQARRVAEGGSCSGCRLLKLVYC